MQLTHGQCMFIVLSFYRCSFGMPPPQIFQRRYRKFYLVLTHETSWCEFTEQLKVIVFGILGFQSFSFYIQNKCLCIPKLDLIRQAHKHKLTYTQGRLKGGKETGACWPSEDNRKVVIVIWLFIKMSHSATFWRCMLVLPLTQKLISPENFVKTMEAWWIDSDGLKHIIRCMYIVNSELLPFFSCLSHQGKTREDPWALFKTRLLSCFASYFASLTDWGREKLIGMNLNWFIDDTQS